MERDPEEIRHVIEATRERMSETAEALAYKTDVRARAADALHSTVRGARESLHDAGDSIKQVAAGVGAAAGKGVERARESLPELHPEAPVEMVKEAAAGGNAMTLAVGAVAAGFLLGLILPARRAER